jgi:hypothetical protein
LVTGNRITINYVELNGMNARLRRDSLGAPLNIQPIINALSPKDKSKPPTRFDLQINTVMVRASRVSYDVMNAPQKDGFDTQHLAVNNLRADIRVPQLKNDDFVVNVKRMGLEERCGFAIDNFTADVSLSADSLVTKNVTLALRGSTVAAEDFHLALKGINSIGDELKHSNWRVALKPGSYITPADFSPFVGALARADRRVNVNALSAQGNLNDITATVDVTYGDDITLLLNGRVADLNRENRMVELNQLKFSGNGADICNAITDVVGLPTKTVEMISRLGDIDLSANGDLAGRKYSIDASVKSAPGGVDLTANGVFKSPEQFTTDVILSTKDYVDVASVADVAGFGGIDGDVEATVKRNGKVWSGSADVALDRVMYKGYQYTDVKAHANLEEDLLKASASIDNTDLAFELNGEYSLARDYKLIKLDGELERVIPSHLNLWAKYPGAEISGEVSVDLMGEDFGHMYGSADLINWKLEKPDGESFRLRNLRLTSSDRNISLTSDFVNGKLIGDYNFSSAKRTLMSALGKVFPTLLQPDDSSDYLTDNNFKFELKIKDTEAAAEFFNLPVSVVYPATITGVVCAPEGDLSLNVSAPFLRNGSKLIENTQLALFIDGSDGTATLDATTVTPTKNGGMTLALQATGHNDRLDSDFMWKIDRDRRYDGFVSAATTFARNDDNKLLTNVAFNRSELTFNNATWVLNPSTVNMIGTDDITVNNIDVNRGEQYVRINGRVSPLPMDVLTVDLRDFSLDYLFESLGIDKVMLCGDATGTFYGSQLLSKEPRLETPGLSVKGIGYNKVVLGDAIVKSHWDMETSGITLDAQIDHETGHRSWINGAIYPMRDSLDITFNVDHANVGFMQPYMEAFASDISGKGSGRARLFGTFKCIDLEGDVLAHDLKLKVNFTNTYYTANDSVHFRPGLIDLSNITIGDTEGHTAKLNGWVRHKYFKEPTFEFSVTGAQNFLSYNETPRENPLWYGKIYGNGSAFVKGGPGVVDIGVDMSTAPKSTFTFVLSDQQVADEYSFLTFRNKNGEPESKATDLTDEEISMSVVNRLKAKIDAANEDEASDYNISLQMRVTPEAQINLVMDPVGGDRIRAYGSGHLRMDYGSANNDLRMYGTYTLDRGDYNFTLQDIIIKEFTIESGSSIAFQGDPYSAQLNIRAAYSLNANLSDLDESFLTDQDLNRTNVPVHAILNVTGDMRQPQIGFDLEFPTLNTDVYRKVKSIISTDDMMNRQIIYLLALNRFYTPEYMASTTKGNQLMSVASSTISSQLSSVLGQISENWNIAPTFRSDRGDFSDVEVDVALSSRLLNNRLLFNGNFGYRDNAMNVSQFVGDFDLEYLLVRSGTWRLKAYNRYNDQNYYLRTALTTQGVGVVFKHDFNSFFSIFKAFKKQPATPIPALTPTTPSLATPTSALPTPTDTLQTK